MNSSFTNAKWSAHAQAYKNVFESLTARWAADSLQVAHHLILPRMSRCKSAQSPFHFLDVGSGPGALTFEFMRRYLTPDDSIHVTATDLSDGMLEQLNEALKEDPSLRVFQDKVSTVQMDGLVLDKVESSTVDVVGSNFGLSIFPTRTRGWEAAHRVLKDDGVLVVTAWDEKSSQMRWFDEIAELYNAAGDESMPLPSQLAGTDKQRVLKELQAAGFRDVKVYHTSHTIVFDDPVGMLRANMNNPATAKFLERLTKEQMETALTAAMEKDAGANFYETERSAASSDPFADGRPRLIPFAAFTILARK